MYSKDEMFRKNILEEAVRSEIEFVSYVDVETETVHTIVTNESAEVLPDAGVDYTAMNDGKIPQYVHPEDVEECMEQFDIGHIKKTLETQDVVSIFYRLKHQDGSYRWKNMAVRYYNADKNILVFTRKDQNDTYERELEHNRQLESALNEVRKANRAKGNLWSV